MTGVGRPVWPSRAAVGAAADRMGVSRAVLSLRRAAATRIPVLTYHRFARRDDPAGFDEGVVDVDPAQFERHLTFVKRWFNPIGIATLRAFAGGRGRLPRNPLMVTFDDGYRDNHDVALPLLVKHGVPAVFFVATDFIERRRLYWWDRVSLVLARARCERLRMSYPEPVSLSLDGTQARSAAVRKLQRIVKDRADLDVARFLGAIERAADVTVDVAEERRLADATVMTWDHVTALRRAGMDVQSHTHTHRVLQTLAADEVDRELKVSRALLEDVLGERITAVSYPVGKPIGRSSPIRRAVLDAGYELGFSNTTGVNRTGAFDPLDVRRVGLDLSMGDAFFRAMLAVPWLAY